MACENCGRDVPEVLEECPFCGASQAPKFDGNVAPPRRKNRSWLADLQSWRLERTAGYTQWANRVSEGNSLLSWMERQPSLPWGLILSIFIPGAGHFYWGRRVLGLIIFLVALCLAAMVVILMPSVTESVLQIELIVVALFLGSVHSHAFSIGQRCRRVPLQRRWLATIFVLIVMFFQIQYLAEYALTRAHGNRQLFQLRGNDLLRPFLQQGDLIAVAPMNDRSVERGDIVMFERTQPERVLGLPDDLLEINRGGLYRNGTLLGATQSALFPLGREDAPYAMRRVALRIKQELKIPDGHLGYLAWGRELRTSNIASCQGIISEIVSPPERAGRFIHGVRVPF